MSRSARSVIRTRRTVAPLAFPQAALLVDAILSHLRIDERFVYVTDSGFGAIVVIDRESGRGHRVLEGEACSRADPTITPVVHGKPLVHADGKRCR